jgi:hypothetical protein
MENIGKSLKARCALAGTTLKEVCSRAGVTPATIRNWAEAEPKSLRTYRAVVKAIEEIELEKSATDAEPATISK